MFQPKPMTHLLIAACKEQMASVVTELYRHRVFHITDFVDQGKKGYEGVKLGTPMEEANETSVNLLKIRSIENTFQTSPQTQFDVPVRPADEIRNIVNKELPSIEAEVSQLTAKRANAETKIREYEQRITELKPFELIPADLELYRGYESLSVYAGHINNDVEFNFPSEKYFVPAKEGNFIVAFVENVHAADAEKLLSDAGYTGVALPNENGSVENAVEKYNSELTAMRIELEEINDKIEEAKAKYTDLLAACDEVLSCDVERAEAPLRFATTDEAFVIDGWVPVDKVAKLDAGLNQATSGKVYITVDDEDINYDEVPVEYKNPSIAKPAEVLMDLYARPKYKEIDPTIILGIMFPLLFGVIVGDVGYGLIYLILTLVLRKTLMRLGEMGKKSVGILFGASGTTILFGILYSEFFGVSFPWDPIMFMRHMPIGGGSHIPQVVEMLIVSVALGIVYICVGRVFGMINHARMDSKGPHRTKAILSSFGWLILFIGMLVLLISVIDLNCIFKLAFPLPYLSGVAGILGLIGSIVLIVAGIVFIAIENPLDLMEIPTNLLSHMLSFCRIAAVGLSSVAIAMVVNYLATAFFIKPALANMSFTGILLILVGVIVLIIGHALNVALGVIGGALHPVRLHYVEFFTKFYNGGGIIYKPFGLKRKFSEE